MLKIAGQKIAYLNKMPKIINHELKKQDTFLLLFLSDFIISNLISQVSKERHLSSWNLVVLFILWRNYNNEMIFGGLFAHYQYIQQFRMPFIKKKKFFPSGLAIRSTDSTPNV